MTLLKNPNTLIGKTYDPIKYHCWHFVEECLDVPKIEDIAVSTAKGDINKNKILFKEVKLPTEYCIILLGKKHVGIYYCDGAYHNDKSGVRWEHLNTLNKIYGELKYYDIC